MTTYKHVMGSGKSEKMQQTLDAGQTDQVLKKIIQDLEDVKLMQAGGLNAGKA